MQGMVFDITGGILTAIGLLFAGITIGLKRKKILKGYREEIDKGRDALTDTLNTKLKGYVRNIRNRIDANFTGFDEMIETEESELEKISSKYMRIEDKLLDIERELN